MRLFTLVLAAVMAFSFAAAPADAGFTRIKKYESFKYIIGKRLTDSRGNWLTLHSNGRVSGYNRTHGSVSGKWSLNHGSACWNFKMGNQRDVDCVWMSVDGRKLRIVRNKGTGKAQVLQIKNPPKKKAPSKKTTKKKEPKKNITNELKF